MKRFKHGTFYIGDPTPINVTEWATLIRKQIGKKDVMTINKQLLSVIAKFGDILIKLGIKSPINSFRLKNMTTDNIIEDISKTMLITGDLPFSNISDCTQETLNWLNKNSK